MIGPSIWFLVIVFSREPSPTPLYFGENGDACLRAASAVRAWHSPRVKDVYCDPRDYDGREDA